MSAQSNAYLGLRREASTVSAANTGATKGGSIVINATESIEILGNTELKPNTFIGTTTLQVQDFDAEAEATDPILSDRVSRDHQRPTDNEPKRIVEAQGWYRDANGTIILTAEPKTVTPHGTGLSSVNCQ